MPADCGGVLELLRCVGVVVVFGEAFQLGSSCSCQLTTSSTSGGLSEIIFDHPPDNARSQRVATKLGMVVERQVANASLGIGRQVDIWQLDNPRSAGSR